MKRMVCLFLVAGGCFGPTDSSTTGGTTGSAGFGMPTLEVTVNGVHYIGAPDSGSHVDLINEYDSMGLLSRTSVNIVASSAAQGTACSLSVDRYGQFVTSFGVGQWTLSGASVTGTDDGVAEALTSPSISTTQGTYTCSGSDCAAVVLDFAAFDSAHAEGYFGADQICSFYLPTGTFSP